MAQQAKSKKKPLKTSEKPEASPPLSKNHRKQSTYSIELWPEQEFPRDFVVENDIVGLFFEQRTGKTYITLSAIEHMPRRDNMAIVLVCILNNKESTWKSKIQEFLPWLNVTEDWEVYKKLPFPKLLLVHFDVLHTVAARIKRARWITFAIVDEAHRAKARGTRQSRALGRINVIPKRLILTGTPMEKQPKDLWAQFRFLLPGLFGTWREFEDEFMDVAKIDMTGVKPGTARWQVKVMQQGMLRSRAPFKRHKLKKLIRMIDPYTLRLKKVDVGILEPRIIKTMVTMGSEQKRLYDRMKKHSVIRLGDGQRVMAPMTVTNIIKRRQIASGFVYDDDGECHSIGDSKLVKLVQLFERLPKPIVIFAVFKPEINAIVSALEALGYDIATVTGATRKKDRPKIWEDFQKAQYDGIVCQTRVGGTGVDMWKSGYAIAHSISHSSIDFDQMKSRLDAKGKEKAAKIYILCSFGTIDEDLYDMVVDKGLSSEEVLSQLKKGSR